MNEGAGPSAEVQELRGRVAELEQRLARCEKVRRTLMARVERSLDVADSSFAIFERTISLERHIAQRTAELAEVNARLVQESQERARAETQLLQAQRLETVGRLAAGVAHEINTPIQYVGDNTRFLQTAFAEIEDVLSRLLAILASVRTGVPAPDLVDAAEEALGRLDLDFLRQEIPVAIAQTLEGTRRVSEIVRSMKEFSHPDQGVKTPTDLNHAIETTLTVARNEWKYVAEVQTDFDETLPPVPCLAGEFNQVILNLITNAAHAIQDVVGGGGDRKGTITVSTRRNGGWAEVRVRDTGGGIPPEARGSVFDPFFTTKPVGQGTGQGLAICHGVIVKKHGGTVSFETEVGVGTTFLVRLPLFDPLEEAA